MIIALVVLAALSASGIIAAVVAVAGDGYRRIPACRPGTWAERL